MSFYTCVDWFKKLLKVVVSPIFSSLNSCVVGMEKPTGQTESNSLERICPLVSALVRVCGSAIDPVCFGGLYQFGRSADGHQKRSNHNFSASRSKVLTPSNDTIYGISLSAYDCYLIKAILKSC
jgi:hypothetical protein